MNEARTTTTLGEGLARLSLLVILGTRGALRPLLPYRTAAKASSWRERPGHHLREGAKGLLHVACRSDHYVLGWDKVWEDPPLPDPFTRGSNFEPYLVRPGVSRNLHPGFG